MLVEDHQVVRQGLVALLSSTDDLEVVAAVGDGLEAIEVFSKAQPDVTLVDLQMPKLGGV
jgi:two-component system NarL family response regulator